MYRPIYNLQFPSWCPELNLFSYRFFRVENYEQQVKRLQHIGDSFSEFSLSKNTGEHAITAYVELPDPEQNAILEWSGSGNTALMDILLLVSLFTGRDVFAGKPTEESSKSDEDIGVIIRDSRVYRFGGSLSSSITYKVKFTDEYIRYNIGYEEGLNRIIHLIRSDKWLKKYSGGYFLLLARQAFHYQPLETAFIQCWTIWEHLFSILNQNRLSTKEIINTSTADKISFILDEYALRKKIDKKSQDRIGDLAKIRHRLVHFGRFPEKDKVHNDAIMFIRLTEFVLAKILGLVPSNVFNTVEALEEYLSRPQQAST